MFFSSDFDIFVCRIVSNGKCSKYPKPFEHRNFALKQSEMWQQILPYTDVYDHHSHKAGTTHGTVFPNPIQIWDFTHTILTLIDVIIKKHC